MTADFEEARRRREHDPNRVRCAHCGKWIFARSTRCSECGTHFRGEAFQFTHESDELFAERQRRRRRILIASVVLLVILVVASVLYFAAG